MPELVEQLEQGQTIVLDGLKSSGQFLPWELAILELGLATGNISASYTRLRDHYLLQQQLAAELKRQLKWPLFIVVSVLTLVLAWACYDQQLSVLAALIRLFFSVALVWGLVIVTGGLVRRFRAGTMPGVIASIIRHLPGFSGIQKAGQTYHYLQNLKQCTDSGLPLAQALKLSARKIPDSHFTPAYMNVLEAVISGKKLSAALAASGLLDRIALPPMTVENPGAADAQAHLVEAAYHHYIEQLWFWTRWLPQLLYAFLPLMSLLLLLSID